MSRLLSQQSSLRSCRQIGQAFYLQLNRRLINRRFIRQNSQLSSQPMSRLLSQQSYQQLCQHLRQPFGRHASRQGSLRDIPRALRLTAIALDAVQGRITAIALMQSAICVVQGTFVREAARSQSLAPAGRTTPTILDRLCLIARPVPQASTAPHRALCRVLVVRQVLNVQTGH